MTTDRFSGELTAVLSTYDFSGISRIVDVGGGQGGLISAILKANPEVRPMARLNLLLKLSPCRATFLNQSVFGP